MSNNRFVGSAASVLPADAPEPLPVITDELLRQLGVATMPRNVQEQAVADWLVEHPDRPRMLDVSLRRTEFLPIEP